MAQAAVEAGDESLPTVLASLEAWVRAAPDATVYVWLTREVETGRLTFGQLYDRAGARGREGALCIAAAVFVACCGRVGV